MAQGTCTRDLNLAGRPWMMITVYSMTADQTMALWRVQTYGQMSQGLGSPCCVTSASWHLASLGRPTYRLFFYPVMLPSALGKTSSRSLRVPSTFPRTFSMTRYAGVCSLTSGSLDYMERPMTRRKPDAKLGCADARATLSAPNGTHRRACDWHRSPHRVRLDVILLCLVFFLSILLLVL